MTGKMSTLDDHLFAALDRLSAKDLTDAQIDSEVKRAEAIVAVADQVTESAKIKIAAAKIYAEHGAQVLPYLPLIGKSGD